ncbi:hypothetical protein IFM89_035479 [Coptis chinensis]|uniref:Cellulose synthase n=1 Tax=Coptis chinensis TaxID=261450 RepID=A0A835H9K2_9MAGN|nr:hypothetical protein IFM89_035479 [Coptis chinensis]
MLPSLSAFFMSSRYHNKAGFDDEKSGSCPEMMEKRFGRSSFCSSTLMEHGGVPQSASPETLFKEAIHVISCGYEDKSDWGREPLKGCAPINLSDRLNQVLQWALGSVEILLSRHCPIWYGYGGRLKWLERFAYINTTIYPITAIPLLAYCTLPAVCLLPGKFIIPQVMTIVLPYDV